MGEICVVTGGSGFIGRALVKELLAGGNRVVRVLDVAPSFAFKEDEGQLAEAMQAGRLEYVQGDIRDKDRVTAALTGASVVFHMVSLPWHVSDLLLHYQVSVMGTKNVVAACISNSVPRLVYTSSLVAVFDGREFVKKDESLPYAGRPLNAYGEMKPQAEQLVLAANGARLADGGTLATCAVRPTQVFGEGCDDVAYGENPITGSTMNLVRLGYPVLTNWTYVGNVAHGHVCADVALQQWCSARSPTGDSPENPCGKAYFITNNEETEMFDFTRDLFLAFGYQVRTAVTIPAWLAIRISAIAQAVRAALAPLTTPVTRLTPENVNYMCRSCSLSSERARKLLNYSPIYTLQEGIDRTVTAYSHIRREEWDKAQAEARAQAPVRKSLGGGFVAKVLLWDNPLITLPILLLLLFLAHSFVPSLAKRPVVSLLATTAMIILIRVFVYSHTKPWLSRLGIPLPSLPSTWRIPEEPCISIAQSAAAAWNRVVPGLVAQLTTGDGYVAVLQSLVALLLFKWICGFLSVYRTITLACVTLFILPTLLETRGPQSIAEWKASWMRNRSTK